MYNEKANVLYLGLDTSSIATFISDFRNKYNLLIVNTLAEAVQIMRKNQIEAVVAEQNLAEMSGVHFFSSIVAEFPDPVRILINASDDAEALIQAINKAHVYRSLMMPWDKEEMKQSLENGITLYRATRRRHLYISQMQQELLKNQRLLNVFRKNIAEDIAKEILDHEKSILAGKKSNVTAMYINITNFQIFLQQNSPQPILDYLKQYIEFIQKTIARNNGMINKFVGGNILSIFGAPVNALIHPQKAVFAALAIMAAIKAFNEQMSAKYNFVAELNIGIQSGEVLIGNMGSQQYLSYNVIGDPVDVAVSLSEINQKTPNKVLISEEIHQMVNEHVHSILLPEKLKVTNGTLAVYQVSEKNI